VRARRLVVVFGLLLAVLAAGYGVMFTVLDDFRDDYGISETWLGTIVAMGFFSAFVTQILIAPQADRGHARHLVLAGLLLNVVGLLGMAFGDDVATLLTARFVMGIGVGMGYPSARRIVILADPDNLGRNLGRLLSADVAGFAMGPAVAAVLVPGFGIKAPFLLIAALSLLFFPVVWRTRVAESVDVTPTKLAFDLLRDRTLAAAVTLGAAVFMMIGAFDALWAVVLDDLDAPDWATSVGIVGFAVPLIIFGPKGGELAQRVGPFRLATLGLSLGSLFMFLYGAVPTAWAMLGVAAVHALSDGFTVSSTGVAVGLAAPQDRQASAQGLLGGVQTITAGITAIAAGAIYDHFGRIEAYTTCALAMATLVIIGARLAGPAWSSRPTPAIDATHDTISTPV
jgi:MFS family permease